jgi:hypothetical protein
MRLATARVRYDADTLAGIGARRFVRHLSGERMPPSPTSCSPRPRRRSGFGCCRRRVVAGMSEDLAAQRMARTGPGRGPLGPHARAVDATPANRPAVRLAALLHDIGKPATFADGHFLRHDAVGADLAGVSRSAARPGPCAAASLARAAACSLWANWSTQRCGSSSRCAHGDGFRTTCSCRAAITLSGLPARAVG